MERRHDVRRGPARIEPDVATLTGLAVASFLAFGALLVLYGANSSELIRALDLGYADLGLLGSCLSLGLGVGIVLAGPLVDRLPRVHQRLGRHCRQPRGQGQRGVHQRAVVDALPD